MSDKYQNKYRIPSARLQNWDYGNCGSYFITICTKNREHYFGEIIDGEMKLNELGNIAAAEWIKTKELRPDMNLELGEYVVMPNHFHAVIFIGENEYNTAGGAMKIDGGNFTCRDAMHRVSTGEMETTANKFGPQSKNLGFIVRGYKSAVTTYARKNNIPFAWQSRFHDHIIRDMLSFEHIENYIANNALNWKEDRFYSDRDTINRIPT